MMVMMIACQDDGGDGGDDGSDGGDGTDGADGADDVDDAGDDDGDGADDGMGSIFFSCERRCDFATAAAAAVRIYVWLVI